MGHLKDIANQRKIQTFPSATFEIEGEVPEAQCSEARFQGDDAWSRSLPQPRLNTHEDFSGFNLAGKVCHITASVGGNTGNFDIIDNTDSSMRLVQDPGNGDPVEYYISNGGALIITRNIQSFAEFISAAGYAYTIKGRKLYTNIPTAQLQPACSILFAPLT